ncbi:hypothetical protein BpHYR1_024895 [Brachionus plicatilis]|uniref:Uncharacterized protein n=1 Tax=Brachionus plicatilis TaxID=10195 RepID=A0A3M7QAA5_BRAPC|nr:hypothetical protein BpHYR1_024895 [Brachionus plicatilis]
MDIVKQTMLHLGKLKFEIKIKRSKYKLKNKFFQKQLLDISCQNNIIFTRSIILILNMQIRQQKRMKHSLFNVVSSSKFNKPRFLWQACLRRRPTRKTSMVARCIEI